MCLVGCFFYLEKEKGKRQAAKSYIIYTKFLSSSAIESELAVSIFYLVKEMNGRNEKLGSADKRSGQKLIKRESLTKGPSQEINKQAQVKMKG